MKTYADALLEDRYCQAALRTKLAGPELTMCAHLLAWTDFQIELIRKRPMTDEHLRQLAHDIQRAVRG